VNNISSALLAFSLTWVSLLGFWRLSVACYRMLNKATCCKRCVLRPTD
jgi:hypothetical protein